MGTVFNIYCDESCHLANDHHAAMVLGAVSCPREKVREINDRLREIKSHHGMKNTFEAKWTKVSPAKMQLYLDLVDYFFDDDDLRFRALIVPEKGRLRHDKFSQDHDAWYYKMYFDMLKVMLTPHEHYRVFIDIKDTRGAAKVRKLHEVLCDNIYDFSREIIGQVQQIRSHEVQIMQIADLLIGAVSYANRGLSGNAGKDALVARIKKRSNYSLVKTTLLRENKMNLVRWTASEVQ
jgi:hypothetical protein